MKTTLKQVFILCYLLLNANYYSNAQTIPSQQGFVYAEGEKFMLDGNPYYFSGTNVYDFFTYGSSSGDIETQFMDKDRIDAHMRRLYVNGIRVVRLWGFSHEDWHGFEPEKGVYSEAQFSLFDYIIKSAEANGIKLIVALENYWNDYGGIKDRLKWEGIDVSGGGSHDQGQFFTHPAAIQGYKDYVAYFITRVNHYDGIEYRNDPTILAWELMNEPRYQGFGDDLSSDVLRAWVDDMGEFIKDIDANHLLGTGLEAHGLKYGFGGDEGNDFIKIHESPYIDFTSAHPYIRESWADFTLEETMALICQWADESHNIIKKPLYVGEFNVEIQERFEWWEEIYNFIEEKKIGASAFWWFPDDKTPRDKFGVFEGDVEVAIYKEHALKMEEMSGGEHIYLSLLSPKSGDKFVSGSDVHIEANLINENNTVAKVEFFSNGVLVGEDAIAPYEFDLQDLSDGVYEITSVATSITGVTKESSVRKIQIGGEGVVVLEYKDASTAAVSNVIKPHFRLFNNSSEDISYADLSVRYWYETEDDLAQNFSVDYAVIGNNNVIGNIINTEGNKYYMELTFDPASGMLGRNAGSGRIEAKIANSNYADVDQTNDYSYDGTKKEFIAWEKVTLYLNGKLISGIEPGTSNDIPDAVITASAISGNGPLSVTFDASGSIDPNRDTLSYVWDFGNGDKADGVVTVYEFIEFGEHIVTLTVNDGNGNTDSTTIIITVTDPNQPPVASYVSNMTSGIAPVILTFDAAGSSDPNNDALTYSWDFGNGNTATGITASQEFTEAGDFEITLTVSDGRLEDTATGTIRITNGDLLASFTTDKIEGLAPLEVNFDASGSVDPSGNALTYSWDFGDGDIEAGVTTSHVFNDIGTYNVVLTIENGLGTTATEAITISVIEEVADTTLALEYIEGGRGENTDNVINPHLQIVNKGNQSTAYQDITIRYWFTSEDNDTLNFWCDWAQVGTDFINGTFGQSRGMDYLEISFDSEAGDLVGNSNSGPIQTRFSKTDWSPFEEDNDYSYDSTITSYSAHDKITLYLNGNLIWGVEPTIIRSNPDIQTETVAFIAYPNPITNKLIIDGLGNFEKARIKLLDVSGRMLKQESLKSKATQVEFNTSDLIGGVYFIEVVDATKRQIRRIVK
ncbi:PKD domain-containing protein [Aquimarina sp. RZ0]|uniref:PKD domain-containing protein n=1 Tax=Aquimarina sp. RZ0 TaxID=2607730 RepID=UPI0011F20904|nr:PKD domain-containing protein [Aquimarina sp. RZ0]KAA1245647.1 PKD domain-containing protein [Aquimarina sp. RZ0]